MNSRKDKKLEIIPYLYFGGVLLFGVGIICCIKQQYYAPLIFLGVALTGNELNIKIFEVWVAIGVLAIFIEVLFNLTVCIFLQRLTVSTSLSILFLFIALIDYTKFGISTEYSVLITLATCTCFIAKLFILPMKISRFCDLVESKQKNKITKLIKYFLELKAKVLSVVLALISASFSTLIFSSSLHKIDAIGSMLLWWTSFWFWFGYFWLLNLTGTKYRYAPMQKILYSDNYQELVIRLFEAGFVLDKKIDNYYQFQSNNFFICHRVLIVKKEQESYLIFGEEKIIKALSDDIGTTCLKIDPIYEHTEIKGNNEMTKVRIESTANAKLAV